MPVTHFTAPFKPLRYIGFMRFAILICKVLLLQNPLQLNIVMKESTQIISSGTTGLVSWEVQH